MNKTDEALMQEVREGDVDMLTPLVSRYERPLFAFICRIVGRSSDAEDIFQETFLRLMRSRSSYREGLPFRPWLYRICLNLCRDALRRRAHRRENPLDEEMCATQGGMTQKLIAYEVRKAIKRLPEKLRDVFILHHYQELTYPEIAESLRIPVGTVKSRMSAAAAKLAEDLKRLGVYAA